MKIGIITWFTYENYGTKLQAIALQRYLRNLGHYVQLINFVPPEIENTKHNEESIWDKIKKQPQKYKLKFILKKYEDDIKKKHEKMDLIIDKECMLSKKIHSEMEYIDICNSFDLLICGSDQIWNPNLYHKYYYADFAQINTPTISYAPSLGVNQIKKEIVADLTESLKKIKFLTVREKNGAALLKELTGKSIATVLDPTFLLSKAEWNDLASNSLSEEKYVLCYFLSDNKSHWNAARSFAKNHKLKLYIIPQLGESYTQKNGKIFPEAGVEDFIGLVSKATYVLTDSFHGTVFSIIFNKQFYVFERFRENEYSSQNSRIFNLLDSISLMERLNKFNTSSVIEKKDIEYGLVNKKVSKMIEESKKVLDKGLVYGEKM